MHERILNPYRLTRPLASDMFSLFMDGTFKPAARVRDGTVENSHNTHKPLVHAKQVSKKSSKRSPASDFAGPVGPFVTGRTLDDVRDDVFSDDTAVHSCASLSMAVLHDFVIVEDQDVDSPEFGNEVEDDFVLLPTQ